MRGAHGNADLVAHFFRRAFALLRPGGCLGLIATNTIGQGDTRESGLRAVIADGGSIIRAIRRRAWPGEAAVVVSVVHILRGEGVSPVLDGRQVRRISAYLVDSDLDTSPAPLAANAGKAFQGCVLLGPGFTFDDEAAAKGIANPVSEMHRLIEKDSRNAERIFPLLGSEQVNSDQRHAHRRWCIDFNDFPLRRQALPKAWKEMSEREQSQCRTRGLVPLDYPGPVAADWPDLLEIVERLVKPERDRQNREARKLRWWQFAEKAMGLRAAIAKVPSVYVTGAAAVMHHMIARQSATTVFSHKIIVFAESSIATFATLQSRLHELWSREFGSTFGSVDALTYNPTQVYRPFPFPEIEDSFLEISGLKYHDFRSSIMVSRNEGLTKTYNRFHNAAEHISDIQRLRELHHAMDVAVLRAYGWSDLADAAAPQFLTEETEPEYRYQGRLFWPAPFRDEVLSRLLDLNRVRAREEQAAGLSPLGNSTTEETEIEEPV